MAVKITEKELEEFYIELPTEVILEVLLRKHFLNSPNFDLFKCIYKGQGYDIEIRKFDKKSSMDMLNELKQENQALKDRWKKLRKFINEKLETSKGAEWYAVEEIDCEMQELEKEKESE